MLRLDFILNLSLVGYNILIFYYYGISFSYEKGDNYGLIKFG